MDGKGVRLEHGYAPALQTSVEIVQARKREGEIKVECYVPKATLDRMQP